MVKSILQHTCIFLISVLYCFTMSIADRDTITLHSHGSESQLPETGFDSSRDSYEIAGYTTHYSLFKTSVKSSTAQKLKIPFNGFILRSGNINFKEILSAYTYTKPLQNFTIGFGSIDIIYPFHTFW